MKSTSETGHAKNVANFATLISFCNGYGATYNPARANLQLDGLNTLHTGAQNSLGEVTGAKTVLITATNLRQELFEPLRALATRVVNALDASGVSSNLVKDARTINRKLQGRRSVPRPVVTNREEIAPGKTISVSRQSYDNLAENFAQLVALVSNEPAYAPNEPELQPDALQTVVEDLRIVNREVADAYTAYSNALIARNQVLYAPENGLTGIAADVKKYIKSVYGSRSPQYRQISGLRFR